MTHTKKDITLIEDRNALKEKTAEKLTANMFIPKATTVSLHTAVNVNQEFLIICSCSEHKLKNGMILTKR